jgi:hypothetical protein
VDDGGLGTAPNGIEPRSCAALQKTLLFFTSRGMSQRPFIAGLCRNDINILPHFIFEIETVCGLSDIAQVVTQLVKKLTK